MRSYEDSYYYNRQDNPGNGYDGFYRPDSDSNFGYNQNYDRRSEPGGAKPSHQSNEGLKIFVVLKRGPDTSQDYKKLILVAPPSMRVSSLKKNIQKELSELFPRDTPYICGKVEDETGFTIVNQAMVGDVLRHGDKVIIYPERNIDDVGGGDRTVYLPEIRNNKNNDYSRNHYDDPDYPSKYSKDDPGYYKEYGIVPREQRERDLYKDRSRDRSRERDYRDYDRPKPDGPPVQQQQQQNFGRVKFSGDTDELLSMMKNMLQSISQKLADSEFGSNVNVDISEVLHNLIPLGFCPRKVTIHNAAVALLKAVSSERMQFLDERERNTVLNLIITLMNYWIAELISTDPFLLANVVELLEVLAKSPTFCQNFKSSFVIANLMKCAELDIITPQNRTRLLGVVDYLQKGDFSIPYAPVNQQSNRAYEPSQPKPYVNPLVDNLRKGRATPSKGYQNDEDYDMVQNRSPPTRPQDNYPLTYNSGTPQNINSNSQLNLQQSQLHQSQQSQQPQQIKLSPADILRAQVMKQHQQNQQTINSQMGNTMNQSQIHPSLNQSINAQPQNNFNAQPQNNSNANAQKLAQMLASQANKSNALGLKNTIQSQNQRGPPSPNQQLAGSYNLVNNYKSGQTTSGGSAKPSVQNSKEQLPQDVLNKMRAMGSSEANLTYRDYLEMLAPDNEKHVLIFGTDNLATIIPNCIDQIMSRPEEYLKLINIIDNVLPYDCEQVQIKILSALDNALTEERALDGIRHSIIQRIIKAFSSQPPYLHSSLSNVLRNHIMLSKYNVEVSTLISIILSPYTRLHEFGMKCLTVLSDPNMSDNSKNDIEFETHVKVILDLSAAKMKSDEFRNMALQTVANLALKDNIKSSILSNNGLDILLIHFRNPDNVEGQRIAAKAMLNLSSNSKEVRSKILDEIIDEIQKMKKNELDPIVRGYIQTMINTAK